MEKKIDIGQKAKVNIVWNISSNGYSEEEEKNIIAAFAKKYEIPASNIHVERKDTNVSASVENGLNSENIKDIHDPSFQQSTFPIWLAEEGIEDYDMDALLKIDSQINALIDYDSYEKCKKYRIKWIDWSNFLSYGKENHFDFTQLKGLVLLNGEPANKSGKSTFAYDLLHFLLFGKTKSGKADSLGEMFNNYLPKETELKVEGCINIDGSDYIIKRTLTRPAKSKKTVRTASQKVEYYKVFENGDRELLIDENLAEKSATETSKVIKDAIGNENDFDLIISANAKDLDDLISLKEDARGKLLSRWIGLSVLEDKEARAKEQWKKLSTGRYCDLYNRETLKADIVTLEDEITSANDIISTDNNKVSAANKKLEKYAKDKEKLLSSKRPVNAEITKAGDMTTLEAKLERLTEEGKNKKAQIPALKQQIIDMGDISYSEDEYKSLQKEKETIIERTSSIKAQIASLKKTNEDLASAEYCPTCHRKFDNVDNSGIIATNTKKINDLIAEGVKLKERKDVIIPQMEAIERKREQNTAKNRIELKIAAIEVEVSNLRDDYKETKNILQQRKDNEEAIRHNDKIDADVNVINESVRMGEKFRDELNAEINTQNGIITRNKASINEKKGIIVKIEEEIKTEKDWKLYLKMMGKDGITKMVLKNALPIINCELNRLLADVSDFKVEVEVNDKKDVDFWLIRDGVRSRLAAASGLERTQAALALRVVLGNMSRLSKPPFILLDEVLGTVDAEFYEDMKRLYDKILKNYDFILHICHLKDWVDYHNQIVTVTKKDNISSIKSVV